MIETKKAHELDIVELTEDLPEFGVRLGERGTVVEAFDDPEEAYMLEFVDKSGASSKLAYGVRPNQIKNIDTIAKEFYAAGMKSLSDGKFVEALRNIRKAVNLIPSYIRGLHNSLAQSIGPYEDWQRFIFAMHLVRLIDPAYEMARDNLAIAYLNYGVQEAKSGKYEESLHIFHAALAVEAPPEIINLIKENISASYTALGRQAFLNNDIESALTLFRSAHFIASNEITRHNFGKAHFHFANFCLNKGNLKGAIDSYERAEDAGLMLPEVLNNHACALADSERIEDAIMILETARAMAPKDNVIEFNLNKLTEMSQVLLPKAESTISDFVTEDIKFDFLNPPMTTIALRTAA